MANRVRGAGKGGDTNTLGRMRYIIECRAMTEPCMKDEKMKR